jgi:hypothetical protein
MLTQNGLKFDRIAYTIVEDFNLIGIANDVILFPNQSTSYRNKLQQINYTIGALTKKYFPADKFGTMSARKKQVFGGRFFEKIANFRPNCNPFTPYKEMVLTELKNIENFGNSTICRVLPFVNTLLNELKKVSLLNWWVLCDRVVFRMSTRQLPNWRNLLSKQWPISLFQTVTILAFSYWREI